MGSAVRRSSSGTERYGSHVDKRVMCSMLGVLGIFAKGAAPEPLCCPVVNCGTQNPRRGALEEAVQLDPDLCNRASRRGGRATGDADLRSRGRWYEGDENSLRVGSALDEVPFEDLHQRISAGKEVQRHPSSARARLGIHLIENLNYTMREHRPNRDLTTPNSILRAIKLWYITPARLHLPGSQSKRRQRFSLAESGDIVLLIP